MAVAFDGICAYRNYSHTCSKVNFFDKHNIIADKINEGTLELTL
jgi:hypothetical protein